MGRVWLEASFARASTVALALSCSAWLVLSCERRVEEPVPRPPPSQVSAPATDTTAPAASTSRAASPPDPRLQGRCVTPLAAVPERSPVQSPDPRCPEDPEPDRVPLAKRGTVTFVDAAVTLSVEVAEQYEDRMRGLMYRQSLSDQEGMLFVFRRRQDHRFWMRNTCVSLDMLFIDQDGLIVGIQEHVPTLNDHTYSVGCLSQYVLEVPAGWSRRNGVRPGQFVQVGNR